MTRRHRIHEDEVPEVIQGLVHRLREHVDKKQDLPAATLCLRCLYRLKEHKAGRPDYPDPITWGFLEDYADILEEVTDMEPEHPRPYFTLYPEAWEHENGTINRKPSKEKPQNALKTVKRS